MGRASGGVKRVLGDETPVALPASWSASHYVGVVALFLFLLEVGSGVLLMVYYRPVPADAYASVWWIMNEAHLGGVVRQIHLRGADLLLAVIAVHLGVMMCRRAYRRPRQITWLVGVAMFVISAAFAFTGVLLPWNQEGYWLADSARRVIAGLPAAGSLALQILWGGQDITDETLLRFYVFHVGILPWVMVLLAVSHLLLVWRHGLSGSGSEKREPAVLSDFALNVFLITVLGLGIVLTLGVLVAAPIGSRADPLAPVSQVWVPWYFAAAKAVLDRLPPAGGLGVVGAAMGLLLAVPFIDRAGGEVTWESRLVVAAGLIILALFLLGGGISILGL